MGLFGSGSADYVLKIRSDFQSAGKGLGKAEGAMGGMLGAAGKLGAVLGGAFAVDMVVDFAGEAIDQFGKVQVAAGAVDAVFGDTAGTIHEFAGSSASDLGLAQSAYEQYAASLGTSIKESGAFESMDQVAAKSNELITVGADLAARFGGDTAAAVHALGRTFAGEFDPLEQFNIKLKESEVQAKAVELGLADSADQVSKSARATALLTLITERASVAEGAFAEQSQTVTGQQKKMNAQMENFQAAIGEVLAPLALLVFDLIEPFLPLLGDLAKLMKPVVSIIAWFLTPMVEGLAAAFDLVSKAISAFSGWLSRIKIPSWLRTAGSWLGFGGSSRSVSGASFAPASAGLSAFAAMPGATVPAPVSGRMAVAAGGPTFNFNVSVDPGVGTNPADIGRRVVEAIRAYERNDGRGWRTVTA